jgi:hypothetical protein
MVAEVGLFYFSDICTIGEFQSEVCGAEGSHCFTVYFLIGVASGWFVCVCYMLGVGG